MPLDRAGTPGQSDAGFDRLIVLGEPCGEAAHGLQGTGGGTLQPRIKLRWLPLTDQEGEVLGEIDGLGDLGLLGSQLGQLLRLSLGALLLTAEDEPRRPARGEGRGRGLRDDGECLAAALTSRWQALGLADAADIGGDAAIAPEIAP